MSIHFPVNADTFLHANITTFISGRFPVTIGGFFKFVTDTGFIHPICAGNTSNFVHKSSLLSTDYIRYDLNCSGTNGLVDGVTQQAFDQWLYLGLISVSATNRYLYINNPVSGKEYLQHTASIGVWPEDIIKLFTIGGRDLNLDGGSGNYCENLMVAEVGLWDRALTETELDSLAAGTLPTAVSNLKNYWLSDAGDLNNSLVDSIGSNNLSIKGEPDAGDYPGSTTALYPPAYSSDHPVMVSGNTVEIEIVQDNIGTPYANQTGIDGTLFTGSKGNSLTFLQTVTGATTDANGKMTIAIPSGVATGNDIVFLAEKSTTSIHEVGTIFIPGSAKVI